MLWHLKIGPAPGQIDRDGPRIAEEAADLGLPGPWRVATGRGFLIEGGLGEAEVRRAAESLLVDPVVESFVIEACGPEAPESDGRGTVVHVLPKPGVTDPEADSARDALRDLGLDVSQCRTVRSYRVSGPSDSLEAL